jgi:hypothetical protein
MPPAVFCRKINAVPAVAHGLKVMVGSGTVFGAFLLGNHFFVSLKFTVIFNDTWLMLGISFYFSHPKIF